MTKEEITICKMYLEEMGKDKDCNEYKLLMQMLEQQPSNDCVSRQAVLEELQACVDTESMYDENNGLTYICYEDAVNWVEKMPPATPTHCIAEVKFSKEDLREICNERIEIECTHGTCKDCSNYVVGALDEEICLRGHELIHKDFYCADFEKRGSENE